MHELKWWKKTFTYKVFLGNERTINGAYSGAYGKIQKKLKFEGMNPLTSLKMKNMQASKLSDRNES